MENRDEKPQLGVSACLVGHKVRFDAGHKRNHFVITECGQHFDLHPVCPEVELGLGTPRPAIQLRKTGNEVRLVYSKQPQVDLTGAMLDFAEQRIAKFSQLDGFIFKKDSPTCGMERVPVVDDKTGMRERNGSGIFSGVLKQLHPDIPTEEEGRLNDINLRENFLERVYAHYRWRQIEQPGENLAAFIDFHKNYKLMLMARNEIAYRQLGQLVASANRRNLAEVREQYFHEFMRAMARVPSRGQHVNVLMHLLGYLKNKLNTQDKKELIDWFESYRNKEVNRVTPLVLLQHHFRHHPDRYIAEQYYLSPFPSELMRPV